jgi:hypothetical protein
MSEIPLAPGEALDMLIEMAASADVTLNYDHDRDMWICTCGAFVSGQADTCMDAIEEAWAEWHSK